MPYQKQFNFAPPLQEVIEKNRAEIFKHKNEESSGYQRLKDENYLRLLFSGHAPNVSFSYLYHLGIIATFFPTLFEFINTQWTNLHEELAKLHSYYPFEEQYNLNAKHLFFLKVFNTLRGIALLDNRYFAISEECIKAFNLSQEEVEKADHLIE